LEQKHKKFVQYEPELFPGLIYRMASLKIVFLVFVSGKIVITGAKEERLIHEGFREIYKIVEECRKGKI
jgi:transcription initiation factor TFIID TATA-box-binding protein